MHVGCIFIRNIKSANNYYLCQNYGASWNWQAAEFTIRDPGRCSVHRCVYCTCTHKHRAQGAACMLMSSTRSWLNLGLINWLCLCVRAPLGARGLLERRRSPDPPWGALPRWSCVCATDSTSWVKMQICPIEAPSEQTMRALCCMRLWNAKTLFAWMRKAREFQTKLVIWLSCSFVELKELVKTSVK